MDLFSSPGSRPLTKECALLEDGGKDIPKIRILKIRTRNGGRTETRRLGYGLASEQVLKCKIVFMATTLRKCKNKQRTSPENAIC